MKRAVRVHETLLVLGSQCRVVSRGRRTREGKEGRTGV